MQLRGKAVVIRRDGGAFVDKVLRASEAGTWLLGTAHKRQRVLLAYQAAQNHGQSVARARECDWVHTRMAQARGIRSRPFGVGCALFYYIVRRRLHVAA